VDRAVVFKMQAAVVAAMVTLVDGGGGGRRVWPVRRWRVAARGGRWAPNSSLSFSPVPTLPTLILIPIVGIAGVGIAVCSREGRGSTGRIRGGTRAKVVGDHGRADRGRDRRLMGRSVGGGRMQRG
jgi:hypothetical protein